LKKIYGLLGKKVDYSLSPIIHNAAFKAKGIDAEYRIFNTEENDLGKFFSKVREGKISGCNVTIPYKEKAFNEVNELSSAAKAIGAINTISSKKEMLIGDNTDHYGFRASLIGKGEGDLGFDPKGKSVFIFGAGGASKGVIYALLSLGVSKIAVTDIDNQKAEALAAYITKDENSKVLVTVVKDRGSYEDFISKTDLLVNATPIGLKDGDEELFDYRYIHEKLYVFDLVYAVNTRLIREAKEKAFKTINGLNMLIYQASESFKIWTGLSVPIDVMKKAIIESGKK